MGVSNAFRSCLASNARMASGSELETPSFYSTRSATRLARFAGIAVWHAPLCGIAL